MIRSMTGFGRGRCSVGGRAVVVEARSVNHRFLDLKLRLPWSEPFVEQMLSQAVRRKVERGALTIIARDEAGPEAVEQVAVNLPLARAYLNAVEEIRFRCGLEGGVSVEWLATQPGVLSTDAGKLDGNAVWAGLAKGVEQALEDLLSARRREGDALAEDLEARIARLRAIVAEIADLAASAPEEQRARLQERLAQLVVAVDPQRLEQEVALLADRADVAEELTRLRTHLDEIERLLASPEPVGRRLDFLAQELHREINTVGSKTQRPEITQRVIDAKVEVERVREQVQNVE